MKSLTTTYAKFAYSVLFAFTLALLLSDASLDFSDGDNMLFHNGPIVTMDRDHPNPEAVYIENGIIKSIGKYDLVSKNIRQSTLVIDLGGKTLMPGFIDSHTHPVISAFLYDMVDLSGFTHSTKDELWNYFTEKVSEYNSGEWILCKGFDQVLVPGLIPPDISFLDSIAPNNPVLIASQSLHSYCCLLYTSPSPRD